MKSLLILFSFLSYFFVCSSMMSMHKEYNGRIHGLPKLNPPNNTKFHIAVISAGELRSFAYVEKSWERYFLKQWKSQIKVFGHIVQTHNCPLATYGLHRFSKLATEYELSSGTSLTPPREVFQRMPSCLTTPEYFPRWQRRFGGFSRGNFVDMHERRKRAYEIARQYAEVHKFEWDLIFFLRLDTGFYDPPLNFYSIYKVITEFESKNGSPAIFIPGSCNFGGVCDRLAIGTPKSMDIYFKGDWTFDVMDMSCSPPDKTIYMFDNIARDKYEDFVPTLDTVAKLKEDLTVHVPSSETILSLWFLMNNITQLNYDRDIAFATVRSEHAKAYCNLSRSDYINNYPNGSTFLWDADKHSMYGHTSPVNDFDFIGNYEQRCGNHTLHYDPDKICHAYPSCSCLKPFGHLYLGVERK